MSEVKTHRVRGQFNPGLDLMTTQEVVLTRDYAALEAECERLRDECEYLANENIELKLLIKNMRQQLSISTGQGVKQ